MPEKHQPLFSTAYLRSVWAKDYEVFKSAPEAAALYVRLKNWADKDRQKETASESTFIDVFFKQTWGYCASGEGEKTHGYTLQQQYPVKGAGQRGSTGAADVALGYFGRHDMAEIPQVLGEFKDDRSGLDKPQTSRPNTRSPVDQCLDYLRESRTGLISPILPTWGLATDMNEFRLYVYGNKAQYQRFVIKPGEGDLVVSLLGDDAEALFQRFLFYRTLHADWLLTTSGKSRLEKLLGEQITHEQVLENVTQKFDANRLISLLLKLRKTSNPTIINQVVEIDADIAALDSEIARAENDMNQLTYRLYKLTKEEIRLVEKKGGHL